MSEVTTKAEWDAAYISDLPDSAFLFIAPGGKKDDGGKTVPRSLRKLPYRKLSGEVDLPHLRNALSRLPQSDIPSDQQDAIRARAQKILAGENEKEFRWFDHILAGLKEFAADLTGQKQQEKDEPLAEQLQEVSGAFYARFGGQGGLGGMQLVECYGDHVIAYDGYVFWWIAYTDSADESANEIVFAPRSEWQEVARNEKWVAKAASLKAGARHSSTDRADLQAIHDKAVALGADCPMVVTKQADGAYRWVLFSSSAYKDRDREIISVKAQAEDIAHLDATGDYGPLRWWHVGQPYAEKDGDWQSYKAGPGLDLGRCDFSALHGRIRIESGIFTSEALGAAFKEAADRLSVSLGFAHPLDEPNAEGVFDHTHTFERSLLPKGVQSNLFVDVPLITSEKERAMDETKTKKLGELIGPDLAQTVLGQADSTQKEADDAGVKFKATDKIGEMTMDELKAFVIKCMGPALDEMKDSLAGKKETDEKAASALAALEMSVKEASTLLGQVGAGVKALDARVKTLEGDLPASVAQGFRASQADTTVRQVETKQVNGSPLDGFFSFAAGAAANPPAVQAPAPAQVKA